ncbi:MAG: hypothetical protein ACK40G_12635 [Cytophagaceae bacterium]
MLNKKYLFLVPLIIIAITATIYWLFIYPLVNDYFDNIAPQWFSDLINIFYPRIEVEKQRYPAYFFLEKSNQILIRSGFVLLILSAFLTIYYNLSFKQSINGWWDDKTSTFNAGVLKVLFYVLLIPIIFDFRSDLYLLYEIKEFYKPVIILKLLGIPFPPPLVIDIMYGTLIISVLLVLFNYQAFFFSIIVSFLFLAGQALFFSFEKVDHGYATFTYASMLMPLVIYFRQNAIKKGEKTIQGWPVKLICLAVALPYFFSGVEKIFTSKSAWLKAETLQSYLLLHHAEPGIWLAKNAFLCSIIPILVILFQLGFILILFTPKLRFIFLCAGIIFHYSIVIFFDVSSFINPWIFCYIFFIDWNFIRRKSIPEMIKIKA